MTECDRLLQKGFITEEFLSNEEREGYFIPEVMKKVWAIELDLLREFIFICEKNELLYWVGDGTLLGAIRHNGFIPWDDDMDVWMPREDYDRLLKLEESEFGKPYFLQTTMTDVDYYSSFARLRNSNTTGILVSPHNKCNNGVYIDIYPIDGLNRSEIMQRLRSFTVHINNVMANAYTFNINPSIITRFMNKVLHLRLLRFDPEAVYKRVDQMCKSVRWSESARVGHVAFTERPYKKLYYNKSDFLNTIQVPFENLIVNVPAGYDHILRTLYGDYKEFPSIEKRGTWHSFTFDPDKPYDSDNSALG